MVPRTASLQTRKGFVLRCRKALSTLGGRRSTGQAICDEATPGLTQARPAPEEVDTYMQTAMVADAWWVGQSEERIREMSNRLYLRNYTRPEAATEYYNLRRGVGTVDHYGSLVLGEYSVPAEYLTLQGEVLPNPRYRGEAWFAEGEGRIFDVDVGHNSIVLDVELSRPSRIMINQNYLEGFTSDLGVVIGPVQGLLALDLDMGRPGRHLITMRYRPARILAGLGVSLASLIGWLVAIVVLRRREAKR